MGSFKRAELQSVTSKELAKQNPDYYLTEQTRTQLLALLNEFIGSE